MMTKRVQNNTDSIVQELFEEVKNRKAELAQLDRPNWRTNMSFSYENDITKNPINLQVKYDARELIMMLAHVKVHHDAYNELKDKFESAIPEFKWCGFTLQDWESDITTKINKIQIAEKRKKLESLEGRLDQLISPEMKRKLELEAIKKELDQH